MTRALLVSPSSTPGGSERAVVGLARQLPQQSVDVHAVLLQRGPLEHWLSEVGCSVEVIDARRTRHLHRTAAVIARLSAYARAVDVVVSSQSKGHVYGGLAACAARRPAIWWQHGIPTGSRIELAAARIPAAAVVAVGSDSVDAQRRLTPRRRIELIRPGVDIADVRTSLGSGRGIREAYGWGDAQLVGIIGRLQEWKGQEVFLRAAAILARSHPDARFLVVGGAILGWEGDYPEHLERLAAQLGIAERVDFLGHRADPYAWFDALDVVVHASFGEPFGLVVVEAMALGNAIVATAAGGPTEIIEDGVSGLLVEPGDPEAVAAAVGRILADPVLGAALRRGAWSRAELFGVERMGRDFANLLGEVTATGAQPREAVVHDAREVPR